MRNSVTLNVVPRLSAFAQLRAAFERTNKAAGISLAILVCLFWAQYLRPQSLGGRAAYVLVSGKSMLPRYHTGDLVLVERQSSYHVGELIAYRVPKGDPMAGAQVIHRIVGGNAKQGFIVQGDNRTAPDVWHPKPGDIVAACFVFVRVLLPGDDKPEADEQNEDAVLRPAA